MELKPSGPEWDRFLSHVDLAEGFRLFFLICPSAAHAESAEKTLSAFLQTHQRTLEVVSLSDEAALCGLSTRLLAPIVEPVADLAWVPLQSPSGVASTDAWQTALRAALVGLNQTRNQIGSHQQRPVILAGTHDLMEMCPVVAPDLWSIRSTVIRLPAQTTDASSGGFIASERDSTVSTSLPYVPPGIADADAARALAAAAKVRDRPGAELDLLRYLIRAIGAMVGRGHVEELRPVIDEALALTRGNCLPESDPAFSTLLNDLAYYLDHLALHAEAEPLMRRALEIDEASLGKNHSKVAIELDNLAQLLKATNRLGEAENLMRRALKIFEASYGESHSTIAIQLNNLASLLQDTNRLVEAETLMRRALEIDEANFGKNHPEVATDLNNLASLLQDTNRLGEAEPLVRRALEIDEANFGKNHPNVARDLNNLAQLLQDTNRLGEAEPLMRWALEIDEASYGKNHPRVAIDLNNLARLLQATNRLNDAEPLMRRMLLIFLQFMKATGHPHPHLRTVIGNYLGLKTAIGMKREAFWPLLFELFAEAGFDFEQTDELLTRLFPKE